MITFLKKTAAKLETLCAKCLRSHKGPCAALAIGVLACGIAPTLQSAADGQQHQEPRPVAITFATGVGSSMSLSVLDYVGMPNTIVAAPDYKGPSPRVWKIVSETPGDQRPGMFTLGDEPTVREGDQPVTFKLDIADPPKST